MNRSTVRTRAIKLVSFYLYLSFPYICKSILNITNLNHYFFFFRQFQFSKYKYHQRWVNCYNLFLYPFFLRIDGFRCNISVCGSSSLTFQRPKLDGTCAHFFPLSFSSEVTPPSYACELSGWSPCLDRGKKGNKMCISAFRRGEIGENCIAFAGPAFIIFAGKDNNVVIMFLQYLPKKPFFVVWSACPGHYGKVGVGVGVGDRSGVELYPSEKSSWFTTPSFLLLLPLKFTCLLS